jgi:LDH2 family malate/lactate/ureidoglycolate dehydrogenase
MISERLPRTMPEDLRAFYDSCFRALGVPADEAAIVADCLLDADLNATDTHGIARLPIYADRIRNGGTIPGAPIEIIRDDGSTMLLDAGHGLGQVAATTAMRLAVERAKAHGVAAVAVRRSNHLGTLAYYSKMALQHDQIGFAVSGVAPTIAPWGAAQALLGSNPWSWAIPSRKYAPIVVDLANGVVTSDVTRAAADLGATIPEGVALDSEGRPTGDGKAALSGSILPMGGHKGYALTLVLEVLASVLPGAAYSYQVARFDAPGTPKSIGHFMLAIDIRRFSEVDVFLDRVDDLIEHLKGAYHGSHQPGARIPGESSYQSLVERSREGIPISEKNRRRALAIADSLGVPAPFNA